MKVVIVARNFDAGSGAAIKKLKQVGYEIEECKDHEFGVGAGEEELYERIKDAEVVIAGLEPYTEHLLSRCPKLKLISRRGIGYDSVDTAACRKFGITLARTTGEVEAAVAEHVLAYILYFARSLHTQSADMHEGLWNRCMHPGAKGRTIGLVGFGGIGKGDRKEGKCHGYACALLLQTSETGVGRALWRKLQTAGGAAGRK